MHAGEGLSATFLRIKRHGCRNQRVGPAERNPAPAKPRQPGFFIEEAPAKRLPTGASRG